MGSAVLYPVADAFADESAPLIEHGINPIWNTLSCKSSSGGNHKHGFMRFGLLATILVPSIITVATLRIMEWTPAISAEGILRAVTDAGPAFTEAGLLWANRPTGRGIASATFVAVKGATHNLDVKAIVQEIHDNGYVHEFACDEFTGTNNAEINLRVRTASTEPERPRLTLEWTELVGGRVIRPTFYPPGARGMRPGYYPPGGRRIDG